MTDSDPLPATHLPKTWTNIGPSCLKAHQLGSKPNSLMLGKVKEFGWHVFCSARVAPIGTRKPCMLGVTVTSLAQRSPDHPPAGLLLLASLVASLAHHQEAS